MRKGWKHSRARRQSTGALDSAGQVRWTAQGGRMAVVYVIQVIAYHGGGIKGWRTVRKPSGEPYSFQTREAAEAALQQHFSNLLDGLNVRVYSIDKEATKCPKQVVPYDPTSYNAPTPR